MQILTPGHRYLLANFENPANGQTIQFIEKTPKNSTDAPFIRVWTSSQPGGLTAADTELITVNDGTTNEEVLAVLINRLAHLQAKHACRENAIVLTKLEEALMWLEKRTADRKARGVEGTNAK